MRSCKPLLVYLILLQSSNKPFMERIPNSAKATHLQEYPISLPRNLTKNYSVMAATDGQNVRNIQTLRSSLSQKGNVFSWKDSEVLATLLLGIIRSQLSQCVLAIVWESFLARSVLTDSLSLLPNVKQVVGDGVVSRLLWRAKQCRAYILLLTEPSSLMYQAEYAAQDAWDYSGRLVIVGLNRSEIDALINTKKGRKTEHILGIVQNNAGQFTVFTNMLYKKDTLAPVFNWRKSVFTNPKYSVQLNIKPRSYRETARLIMKHSTTIPNFTQPLFPDKIKNLQGSTLTVATFHFPPEIIYRYDANGNVVGRYGGNVRMVETVAEIFNFSMHYIEPPHGILWGYELANGSWTGLVGVFERGEGDIGIANLFISDLGGRHKYQHYTSSYGQQTTCFMLKKGTKMPRWQSLALPFTGNTWIAVLVMAFFLGPIFFVLSRPHLTSDEKLSGQSLAFINLYTFGVHLKVAQTRLPVRVSLQIFVGIMWVYVIIVLEAYCAKLVSFLTVERIPPGVNTFDELHRSSLPIYGNTPFYKDNLALSQNLHARKLAAQYSVMMDFEEVYKHLIAGRGAYMASRNNLIYTISLYSKSGIPTLRLMKECFQPYSTALGVQSNSPLKRSLNRAVTWIAESGMPYQWVRETLMIVRKDRRATSNDTVDIIAAESGSRVSFTLEHLQGVFIMFGVGCGLSFLVFLTEIPF